MVCDVGEDVTQIRLGIDAAELSCAKMGYIAAARSPPVSAPINRKILASQADGSQCVFHDVIVDLYHAVVAVINECLPLIRKRLGTTVSQC
jgi:hypothetical protein